MKFTENHYNSLKECMANALNAQNLNINTLKESATNEGRSEIRFLWDMFWFSRWTTVRREDYINGDYMDSHIQTAIKQVVKELSN